MSGLPPRPENHHDGHLCHNSREPDLGHTYGYGSVEETWLPSQSKPQYGQHVVSIGPSRSTTPLTHYCPERTQQQPADGLLGDNYYSQPGWQSSPSDLVRCTARRLRSCSLADLGAMFYRLVPGLVWMRRYRLAFLKGDTIGALTVASLYIPLAFSFATVAHVPSASSLYAFVFHPCVYALLGSCPLMVVGPEATGSLLVGAAIHQMNMSHGELGDEKQQAAMALVVSGTATALAGLILLVVGTLRLGFVDNILSRPLTKGFIGGVGSVLIVEQALPGLGLASLVRESGVADGTALVKLGFLANNLRSIDLASACFCLSTLVFVLGSGYVKKRYPSGAIFPDRLLAIVVAAVVCWLCRLDKSGLEVVGSVGSGAPKSPVFVFPFQDTDRLASLAGSAVLISLMGYFESSVTAKSLRPSATTKQKGSSALAGMGDRGQSTRHSANQELIALGSANLVGGCFSTLPAFGGFGRSKLNVQAGSMTPMSGVLLSIITLLCIFFALPLLYFVPKPVLAAMCCAVGISMLEECQHDVVFFFRARAWRELSVMAVVSVAIFVHSMAMGIAIGLATTLVAVTRLATRPQSHIIPDSTEPRPTSTEYPGLPCPVVKVKESMTFANSGGVVAQVNQQVESMPSSHHIILDLRETTELDICGVQIMAEALSKYVDEGIRVIIYSPQSPQALRTLERGGVLRLGIELL